MIPSRKQILVFEKYIEDNSLKETIKSDGAYCASECDSCSITNLCFSHFGKYDEPTIDIEYLKEHYPELCI